jgi:hypothetical protein
MHGFAEAPQAHFVPASDASLDSARFEPENRRRLSGPAFRTFLAIADRWGLNEGQRRMVLGFPARSTFHNWAKLAREQAPFTLDLDVLVRISAVFGIHQALGVLMADEAEGISWLTTPHDAPLFGGQPPLALITAGAQDGLMAVRRFLDAARSGLYMAPNAVDAAFAPYGDSEIVFR